MKKYTPATDPVTGQFLPQPRNEERARQRRAKAAALRGGLTYKPPRGVGFDRSQEATRRRDQMIKGFFREG